MADKCIQVRASGAPLALRDVRIGTVAGNVFQGGSPPAIEGDNPGLIVRDNAGPNHGGEHPPR
jgi:hypothetical protein